MAYNPPYPGTYGNFVQQIPPAGYTYQSSSEIYHNNTQGAVHAHVHTLQQKAVFPTSYHGHTLAPQPVQQLISDTAVPKYSYYNNGAVQPEVQIIQQGGTQMVVQPAQQPHVVVQPAQQPHVVVQPAQQPHVVVQPAQQPAVVVQAAQQPAVVVRSAQQPSVVVRPAQQPSVVIQPAPQPAVVVQAAPQPSVRVIQAPAKTMVYRRYY
ncbi:cell division protein ZipA-like [Clarias gariepinus]|uniref:cell division protein ZipA-like n=1 Tax=Clarias gariepinus TaxID=13013 RepID=UPI00234C1292|nr:cell division protein ZipA-like [Clarias gariepinus]